MPPTQRTATFSSTGSTTKNVGSACTGNFLRNPALLAFSVSISSQTNRPACRARDLSVKTKARIERHVCHHGAQASMKIGMCLARATASARA